jgi:hypothetical protein
MAIYPTEYKIYNIAGKQRQLKPSGFPKKESANQKNQRKEREKKKTNTKKRVGHYAWTLLSTRS